MIIAAKRVSQVGTHMVIAYVLAYALTGSAVFSGLAVLIEPVINVLLLPLHQAVWARQRRRAPHPAAAHIVAAAEKLSQVGLHAGVAFGVTYVATGSVVAGGLLALLEPVCNVIVLPLHDRMWEGVERNAGLRLPLRAA